MADIPSLIALGERMRLESVIYYPPIDREYLTARAEQIIASDKAACFVAENGSNIVGFLLAFIGDQVFTPERIAAHDTFYVVPEARKSTIAFQLIRAFIRWAESLGITRQLIRLDTGLRPDKVDRLYRRFGFEPIGGQYLRCVSPRLSQQSGRSVA